MATDYSDPRFAIAIMQPSQITRGLAFRRYAYRKPIQEIADETGLRPDQLINALKGLPITIDVAARLTGWLRTPVAHSQKMPDRHDTGVMTSTRQTLLRRLARVRSLAVHIGQPVSIRAIAKLAMMTDDELRAFVYNVEDLVRERILELYPTIARYWKFADDMEPWEVIERIDRLKNDPQARNTFAHHQRKVAAKAARAAAKAA